MSEPEAARNPEPEQPEVDEIEASRMPLLAHLEELRSRLIKCAIAVGVCFTGTYAIKERLYAWLTIPLKAAMPPGAKLIYTSPAEAFFTYIKIAFLAAVVAASPVIFYQLWRFISPGLYRHERRMIWPFVVLSSALFIGGAVFCYTIVFPFAFQFFMSFATEDILPMMSLKQYLSFSSMLLLAFGIIFEMPLVLVFLGKIGLVSSRALARARKYAILIMFVVGAIFTPPDVFTQILMAVPLIALYEISIWLVRATERRKGEEEFDAHESDSSPGA